MAYTVDILKAEMKVAQDFLVNGEVEQASRGAKLVAQQIKSTAIRYFRSYCKGLITEAEYNNEIAQYRELLTDAEILAGRSES